MRELGHLPFGGLVHEEPVGDGEGRVQHDEDQHLFVHEAVDGAAPVEQQPRERPQPRVGYLQWEQGHLGASETRVQISVKAVQKHGLNLGKTFGLILLFVCAPPDMTNAHPSPAEVPPTDPPSNNTPAWHCRQRMT